MAKPAFLARLKKLWRQDSRINAALAQGRELGAGAAGLENRHVFVGSETVTLQNQARSQIRRAAEA